MNEALLYGVPIITTPLSVLEELPVKDSMVLVCNWDMSNVDKIVRKIFESKKSKFSYKAPKDNWNNLLANGKSTYKENSIVELKCISTYTDLEKNKLMTVMDKPFKVTRARADYLIEVGACEEV